MKDEYRWSAILLTEDEVQYYKMLTVVNDVMVTHLSRVVCRFSSTKDRLLFFSAMFVYLENFVNLSNFHNICAMQTKHNLHVYRIHTQLYSPNTWQIEIET